jgi:hypothetical protein
MQTWTLLRGKPEPLGARALTFIVDHQHKVYWWPVLTRHRSLRQHFQLEFDDVAWGGVLGPTGLWERASIDHGDAPDAQSRDEVVQLLVQAWQSEEQP